MNKITCIEYLKSINKLNYTGVGLGCNGVWDEISCIEAIPANTTAQFRCPAMKGFFDTSRFFSKKCLQNGFWEGYEISKNSYAGYTDYKVCLTEHNLKETEQLDKNENIDLIFRIVSYVELSGITLSILCICISLLIFGYHKSLRCKRTKIHLNLFIAILFAALIRLVFFVDRIVFKLKNPNPGLALESQLMLVNKAICPMLTTILEYSQLCNFMWMCNEGIYLNVLLSYAVFNSNHKKIIIGFCTIGWCLPLFISTSWAITVYNTIGIDDICWLGYYDQPTYWIIKGPIFASLLISVLCLINVIRILTKKLRQNNSSEIDQIKKSTKAAIFLLPLLGVTHIFEVYYGMPSNWIVNLIFSIVKAILVFYQGVFLSIIYCFMNKEVKSKLKRHWLDNSKFRSLFLNSKSTCDRINLTTCTNGGSGGGDVGDGAAQTIGCGSEEKENELLVKPNTESQSMTDMSKADSKFCFNCETPKKNEI